MTPYHAVGDECGGVRIIGIAVRSDRAVRHRVYRVKHFCCGLEEDMMNDILKRRTNENTKQCHKCGRKNKRKRDIQIVRDRQLKVRKCKSDLQFKFVNDIQDDEEKAVLPSANDVIGLWYRANARVIQRNRARP